MIGARKLLCFSAQSKGRTAATVWNWSGKTLSPGAFLCTFLRAIFFRPFRLSLAPTIYSWVSEDALDLEKFRVRLQKRSERSHHMKVEDLTLLEQTTQLTHMPSYRGKYTKSQHFSPTFLSSITHVLYRACTSCLACQHFDLKNADWFSDSQHLSSR